MNVTWNDERILADCGGPNDLHAALKAEGYDVQLHTVQSWSRRKSIPKDWLAVIINWRGLPSDWIVEDIF